MGAGHSDGDDGCWVLQDRITRLEFSIGNGRVPVGMTEMYERWVQLGLGEIEPKTDETGIAWFYRRVMGQLHDGKHAPANESEADMLARYRGRLARGLIRPFDFPGELDALEDGR